MKKPALPTTNPVTGQPIPLATQIAEHPFVAGLSQRHLQILTDCAMQSHFQMGELIFREGDPANRFYLIQQGKVILETHLPERPAVRIGVVGAGDVLGWSWLFPPYYWHFDARTDTPTDAIFFYGTRLREECDQDHDLGYELMKRMAAIVIKRLQLTRRQLIEASTPARPKR